MVTEVFKRVSKPRYRWWGFARKMIRDYPGLCDELKDRQDQNTAANLSGMPRGSGNGRTVEMLALRQLEEDDQKVYDAVSGAIASTKLRPDGETRIKLIKLMYWVQRPMTAKVAAPLLHIGEATAKRWHGDFVRLVGRCYGFKS